MALDCTGRRTARSRSQCVRRAPIPSWMPAISVHSQLSTPAPRCERLLHKHTKPQAFFFLSNQWELKPGKQEGTHVNTTYAVPVAFCGELKTKCCCVNIPRGISTPLRLFELGPGPAPSKHVNRTRYEIRTYVALRSSRTLGSG